jgi:hypothetical protein
MEIDIVIPANVCRGRGIDRDREIEIGLDREVEREEC